MLFPGFRERDALAEEGFCGFVDGAVVFGAGPLDGEVEDCGLSNKVLEEGGKLGIPDCESFLLTYRLDPHCLQDPRSCRH